MRLYLGVRVITLVSEWKNACSLSGTIKTVLCLSIMWITHVERRDNKQVTFAVKTMTTVWAESIVIGFVYLSVSRFVK
jgi:hypothetical protein